jgi:electron transfer flavoprotein alpha/beta subunit
MVLLIAALPISIQGLGPAQGAMILFFGRYASGDDAERAATVLAAGLGAQAIAWVVQILIGTAVPAERAHARHPPVGSSTRDPVTAP